MNPLNNWDQRFNPLIQDEKFWCFPPGKVQAILKFVNSISAEKKIMAKMVKNR